MDFDFGLARVKAREKRRQRERDEFEQRRAERIRLAESTPSVGSSLNPFGDFHVVMPDPREDEWNS